jgi:hypothetical protein
MLLKVQRVGLVSLAAGMTVALPETSSAQSLSTVSHPDVRSGETTFDYRAGYALRDDGRSARFGQRFHIQKALNGAVRFRVQVQQGERADGVVATQFVSPQVQLQLVESERSGGWDSALRFDGFIPVDGRPGRTRLGLFNAFDLGGGVEARSVLFFACEIGDHAASGVQLEAREELSFPSTARTRVGAQLFHGLNSTAHLGDFDEQRHQLGVFARSKVTRHLGVEGGWLFGLSQAAPDADFRIILTYSL